MSAGTITTNHDEIRRWVEARGGEPAVAKATRSKSGSGVLRIDFPGYSGEETLEPLDWDSWFDIFERNQLAFLHQDHTSDGKVSRFNKLVAREHEAAD